MRFPATESYFRMICKRLTYIHFFKRKILFDRITSMINESVLVVIFFGMEEISTHQKRIAVIIAVFPCSLKSASNFFRLIWLACFSIHLNQLFFSFVDDESTNNCLSQKKLENISLLNLLSRIFSFSNQIKRKWYNCGKISSRAETVKQWRNGEKKDPLWYLNWLHYTAK